MNTLSFRTKFFFSSKVIFALVGLVLIGQLTLAAATPAVFDPTCSAASRFNRVIAARFEAERLYRKAARKPKLTATTAGAPEIGVLWDSQGKGPQLTLRSDAGNLLQVEAAASLQPSPPWQPILGLRLSST